MKLAIIYSRACYGLSAPLVTVEVHLSNGMAGFHIVGMAETAVKESKERVRSAILNAQFEFPAKRMTINLAPADLPKEGGRFDLPIALGILAASGQLPREQLKNFEFTGELALSGALRAVKGILPMMLSAKKAGRTLVVPEANSDEAGLLEEAETFSAGHLLEVCGFLHNKCALRVCEKRQVQKKIMALDFKDVRGQPHAKRALEIAAAGKHSTLLYGPPGTGKTMLASRLPTILPPLSEAESLEVAAIASISNEGFKVAHWRQIPFRAPHHSSSTPALVGGGRPPKPGEISLAHHGVLFLDELPEYKRDVLESLREPLESKSVTISRAAIQVNFPANFQLIAAMNPCPCGQYDTDQSQCFCSEEQIRRYRAKISAPLLDRIDLQIHLDRLPPHFLSDPLPQGEASALILERVLAARHIQLQRQGKFNAHLSVQEVEKFCHMEKQATQMLSKAMEKFKFSARVYHRLLKTAQTSADLENVPEITVKHIAEAIQMRVGD